MKISFLTLLAAALVISPIVASAQTTTERRTFTLTLTGYKNGVFTETTNTTGTVTYRQTQLTFRLATIDLIKLINAEKGKTNTTRARMTINSENATYTIIDGTLTNEYAFDQAFSMDCWEESYAETFSGNYNDSTERGVGSARSAETWNITMRIGAKTIKLKGRVTGSESWNYTPTTSSETSSQSIRVTGELLEGLEAFPMEGTISAYFNRTTR